VKYSEENIRECVETLRPRCWPEETTICYKISLAQWLITNLNVVLYLSTWPHRIHKCILYDYAIIKTYFSLMYELKKNGNVFTSKFVRTGPSSCEKRIYRAAVSQRLKNTVLHNKSGTNKLSKNVGETSKFYAPEEWHEPRSTVKNQQY